MDMQTRIDLEPIAHRLKLPLAGAQRAVDLLDEGNTVPFITRYRKDQTGGLDEEQIFLLQAEVRHARQLLERKQTILKSIEAQQQLTPELAQRIEQARSMRALEDLYLPFKPKKKTLAQVARSRGLEPLAREVLAGDAAAADLQQRAADFVLPENELPSTQDVLQSLQHLIAEHFGDSAQLRSRLRRILWRDGRLVSRRTENLPEADQDATASPPTAAPAAPSAPQESQAASEVGEAAVPTEPRSCPAAPDASPTAPVPQSAAAEPSGSEPGARIPAQPAAAPQPVAAIPPTTAPESAAESPPTPPGGAEPEPAADPAATAEPGAEPAAGAAETRSAAPLAAALQAARPAAPSPSRPAKSTIQAARRDQRREARQRRRQRLIQSFKDYFDFSNPLNRIPHYRVLAINRGERTKVLRVKIEVPHPERLLQEAESLLIPADHPHADFLRGCLQNALNRLVLPSLEREIRRELTEKSDEHAVAVFAQNLRKLLLQPPLRNRRLVAIDPGCRNGCKLVALDPYGKVLDHTLIHLVGSEDRRRAGREALVAFVKQHQADAIAIGNGTGCRDAELVVADILSNELQEERLGYLIVNEAGASVYSTSEIGREELPAYDATVRGAVSIGRRALDPLSELVKIDPGSIGVGLYQHDVKAKHLRESLDQVVESCVNYVGVDVNAASPALLRYVSGLNSLTARRIFDHRQQHGPFRNRNQLKDVPGIGEATFVQAAGFLKIAGGDNPLDETWIHPESYETAERLLEAVGSNVSALRRPEPVPAPTQEDPTLQPGESAAAEPTPTEPPAEGPESDGASAATAPASAEASGPDPGTTDPAVPGDTRAAVALDRCPDARSADLHATGPGAATHSAAPPAAAQETAHDRPHSLENAPPTQVGNGVDAATDPPSTPTASSSVSPAPEPSRPEQAQQGPRQPGQVCAPWSNHLKQIDVHALSRQLGVGQLLLEDMITALVRPGRDPREDLPPPVFRRGVLKLEDLKPGMELSGTVLNVVDFGAFVDIGLVDSGLIHVSRLANHFVTNPHDVVSVGDILRVWVVDVDPQRRRVSLTAIEPGTEKPGHETSRSERAGTQSTPARRPKSRRGGGKPKPAAEGAGRRKEKRAHRTQQSTRPARPARPRAVAPITKAMQEGREPMRTFSDLKQFFEQSRTRPQRAEGDPGDGADAPKKS
jgi:uncharacterized protein